MKTPARRHPGRPTRQWKALVDVLAERNSFRSAAELYDTLRGRGHKVALVTIYRHLDTMSRQGTVTTVTGLRGEARYRLSSATADRCPLICRRCQRVVDTDAVDVAQWAATTAAQHGFVDIQMNMMMAGVCLNCLR